MARLIDHLATDRRVAPQMYIYNFMRSGTEAIRVPYDVAAARLFDANLAKIGAAPVVVADEVVDLIFAMPRENWELDKDMPCLLPQVDRQFVEMRRPRVNNYLTTTMAAGMMPEAWGWLIERLPPDALGRYAAAMKQPIDRAARLGLVATLSIRMGRPAEAVIAPVYTIVTPLDARGRLVGDPITDYPFDVDEAHRPDRAAIDGYFMMLLLPALLTLACFNSDLTEVDTVVVDPQLQKVRARRGKPAFHNYNVLRLPRLVDVLRYEGYAGLYGLREALRTCRRYFVHGAPEVIGLA